VQLRGAGAGAAARRVAAAVVRAEVDHGRAELVADGDRPSSWTLLIDGTAQSHVDLADPTHLEFEYVRRIAHVLDALAPPPPAPRSVLHLGGGAWTLARYVAATRPHSAQRVVEIDAALVELVRARLPADGLDLDVHLGDARAALADARPGTWDAVVLDVFAGARIPAHLTSVEFVRAAARALGPGGVYVANLADGTGGTGPDAADPPGTGATGADRRLPFARAQVATAAAVFDEVAVVAAPDVLHGRRFGNVVLVAGRASVLGATLPAVARRVAADPFPARVVPGAAAGAPVVTDATARPSPRPPAGFFGQ
jgi:SAM-dependent methyltransferase